MVGKICTIKFKVTDPVVQNIMKHLGIDLSNTKNANETLEIFIKDYLVTQLRIAEESGLEISIVDCV